MPSLFKRALLACSSTLVLAGLCNHAAQRKARASCFPKSSVAASPIVTRRPRHAAPAAGAARESVGPARSIFLGSHGDDRGADRARRAAARSATADRSATCCSTSPASPDRPSHRARAGRSFAASIISVCACRRTAHRRSTSRRSARTMRCRSIRCPRIASRWCGDRRRCATARRRSAASSASTTTAFRCRRRRSDSRGASAARSRRSIAAAKARSPVDAPRQGRRDAPRCVRADAQATTAFPAACRPTRASRAEGGAIGGSAFFNGGFFGLALTNTRSLYHIPGTESAASNTRIDLEQTKLLGKGEFRPDSAVVDAVRLWFGATEYRHFEKSIGDDGVDGVQATFRNREQEARVETQLQPVDTPIGVWTAAPGIQFNHQNLGTSGEAGSLLAPSETTAGAFYLFNELRVTPTLKLQAAGRVDRAHVDGTAATFPADLDGLSGAPVEFGARRDFTPLSASVGALQALPYGLVAGLSAQYVERAPRALELFAKGPHDASGTFEIGDPEPEEGSRDRRRGKPAQAARQLALRRHHLPHALSQLHLPPGDRAALRRRLRILRPRRRHRTAAGGIRAARRAVLGRGACDADRPDAARRAHLRRRRTV